MVPEPAVAKPAYRCAASAICQQFAVFRQRMHRAALASREGHTLWPIGKPEEPSKVIDGEISGELACRLTQAYEKHDELVPDHRPRRCRGDAAAGADHRPVAAAKHRVA